MFSHAYKEKLVKKIGTLVLVLSSAFTVAGAGLPDNTHEQPLRDLLGFQDRPTHEIDGDTEIISKNEDLFEARGSGCTLNITSFKETRRRDDRTWSYYKTSVTINYDQGSFLSFKTIFFPSKTEFKKDAGHFWHFQQELSPSLETLADRGAVSPEYFQAHRYDHGGSPEGDFAVGIIAEGFHALTGNLLRSRLNQSFELRFKDGKINAVTVKINEKKLTCDDLVI